MNKNKINSKVTGTIIITGNGFDLQCGLNSSYRHFFEWCQKDDNVFGFNYLIKTKNQQIIDWNEINRLFLKDKVLCVWDIYFIANSDIVNKNWCDIENKIYDSLNGERSLWEWIYKDLINYYSNYNYEKSSVYSYILYMRYFAAGVGNKQEKITKKNFYEILLEELKILEIRFSNYLIKEINENQFYYIKQQLLIKEILKVTGSDKPYQIITFNYTNYEKENFLNIHGDLSFPIFGISLEDDKKISPEANIFTKRKRRVKNDLLSIGQFIKNEYNDLIFYGTSFNKMDYDHFKRIIDKWGGGKMYFCYSNYNGKNMREDHKENVEEFIDGLYYNEFFNLRENDQLDESIEINIDWEKYIKQF